MEDIELYLIEKKKKDLKLFLDFVLDKIRELNSTIRYAEKEVEDAQRLLRQKVDYLVHLVRSREESIKALKKLNLIKSERFLNVNENNPTERVHLDNPRVILTDSKEAFNRYIKEYNKKLKEKERRE